MKPRRSDPLQVRTLMSGRGDTYFAKTEGLPLSLKCMANGRARYQVAGREFTVDDGGWLIVNEGQPYSIEIASPTVVETFVVWFPRGWADEVRRSMTAPSAALLAEPENTDAWAAGFFERYTPNETAVAPRAQRLRTACLSGEPLDDAWLEEELRHLLAGMLATQCDLARAISRLPAARAGTRDELWRRVNRARDFIHARCDTPLTLSDGARVAALSPHHFLRTFKAAFHQTPHEWLAVCRVERAKLLLTRTELPVAEVCFAVGYESIGSFITWFHRQTGHSPRAWRKTYGALHGIRNFREVFHSPALLPSAPPP